ncbi:Uncharacterised protein [Escherichia coli]|nr:Uncharacterised protein [Escherichia coli]
MSLLGRVRRRFSVRWFHGILSNNLAIPQKPLIPANSNPAPTKPLNKKKPLFTV